MPPSPGRAVWALLPLASAWLLAVGSALAQTPARPPEPPPEPAPEPAPPSAPQRASESATEPAPRQPVAEPTPPEPDPEPAPQSSDLPLPDGGAASGDVAIPGWFRMDADDEGLRLWVGATHRLGPVDIASNLNLAGAVGRLDLGIAFAVGPIAVVPLFGLAADFATQQLASLVPQAFLVVELGPLYLEQWTQLPLNSPTGYGAGDDRLRLRQFLLYAPGRTVAFGPQAQVDIAVNAAAGQGVLSAPVGGRVNLSYGMHNTLGLFIGYEVVAQARRGGAFGDTADGIRGRFTLIRTW